jgi:hypothetical protein
MFVGGAAGLEIDRADTSLGTPPHALRVAVADKFPASYKRVGEEALHSHSAVTGTTTTLPAHSSFLVLNSLIMTRETDYHLPRQARDIHQRSIESSVRFRRAQRS